MLLGRGIILWLLHDVQLAGSLSSHSQGARSPCLHVCTLSLSGCWCQVVPVDGGVEVALKVDGSGAGRGGTEQKDVLPPLMPGLKARQTQ